MKQLLFALLLLSGLLAQNIPAEELDQRETVKLDGIKAIEVRDRGANGVGVMMISLQVYINIIPENREDLLVDLSGSVEANKRKCLPAFQMSRSGDTLDIVLNRCQGLHFFLVMNGRATLDVRIPQSYDQSLSVNASSARVTVGSFQLESFSGRVSSGNLSLEELEAGPVEIRASSGDISFTRITADSLSVNTTSGGIRGEAVQSDTGHIESSSGDIRIGSYRGDGEFGATSGNISLKSLESGTADFSTSSGDINLGQCRAGAITVLASSGSVKAESIVTERGSIETSSGNIRVGAMSGENRLQATSGDIRIDNSSGDFNIRGSSSTIKLPQASGSYTIKDRSSPVEADFSGRPGEVKIDSSSGDITVRGLFGKADLSTTSGRISIGFSRLTQDSSIETSSGDALIYLPRGSEFRIKARTSSGRIEVDFPVTLAGRLDRDSLSGVVGRGEQLLEVKTTSGNIKVLAGEL